MKMNSKLLILLGMTLCGLLLIAGCKNATPRTVTSARTTNTVTIGSDEASCPVLGTVMKKSEMTPVSYQGKTYYMCCPACISRFKANPAQYIQHPATPRRGM